MVDFQTNLEEFLQDVGDMLTVSAKAKGYHGKDEDGRNLYDFIHSTNKGDGHAVGEIIYKITRYTATHNEKDLIKIAAWAFLIWDKAHRE